MCGWIVVGEGCPVVDGPTQHGVERTWHRVRRLLVGVVQDGTTALYTACESGATALVRLLLSASARPGVPRRVRLVVIGLWKPLRVACLYIWTCACDRVGVGHCVCGVCV
jgi:hypothetical protein